MDGRGGCCIARYSGGVGGMNMNYGMSKVEKIMLRFRPIAPKPMAAGSASSGSTSDGYTRTKRRKRKYVRVNAKNKKRTDTVSTKRKKPSPSSSSISGGEDAAVLTLPLIPETPDRNEKPPSTTQFPDPLSYSVTRNNKKVPIISCDHGHVRGGTGHVVSVTDTLASPSPLPQVDSFVTMECVAETWLIGEGLGLVMDEVRVMSMENDTCPWFVTNNNQDTVVWANKAYREITTGGGSEEPAVVIMKKNNEATMMPVSMQAFACKVKVTWWPERTSYPPSLTAPCDVWRLQSGGYAWRLDVTAALSLGR